MADDEIKLPGFLFGQRAARVPRDPSVNGVRVMSSFGYFLFFSNIVWCVEFSLQICGSVAHPYFISVI